jgi:hypothetical protein
MGNGLFEASLPAITEIDWLMNPDVPSDSDREKGPALPPVEDSL